MGLGLAMGRLAGVAYRATPPPPREDRSAEPSRDPRTPRREALSPPDPLRPVHLFHMSLENQQFSYPRLS